MDQITQISTLARPLLRIGGASVALSLMAGAPPPPDATTMIGRAESALRTAGLKSLRVNAIGTGGLYGQAYRADTHWPAVNYIMTRTLDFENGAFREDAARSRREPLGGGVTPPMGRGSVQTSAFMADGISWNGAGAVVGPSPGLLRARIHDLWTTSPQGAIIAAKQYDAKASVRSEGGHRYSTLSFKVPDGFEAEVWVNDDGLVSRIDAEVPDSTLGDTLVVTRFDEYQYVGALRFPMRIRQSWAGGEVFDLNVQEVSVNQPTDIAVPEAIRTFKPSLNVEKIADGVWFLVGDSHNSVALEMEDQILLVESPLSDRYAQRLFEIANRLVRGKMVRTVVSSHHHFDHTGGLRYAAAQSATIVVSSLEKAFYERVFSNPNSVVPDALARSRNKVRLTAVDGKRVFADPVRPIEVHELLGDHSRGWLMVYLPKEKVLVEADAFHIWPPGAPPPTEPIGRELSLVNNIERLNLQVERILPLHGRASTVQELYERVGKKPPG